MHSALGLPHGKVQLVPHDARWSAIFADEELKIRSALGEHVKDLVHIGSTAVPNIDAKPVLDLMLGLGSLRCSLSVFEGLHGLGYELRPFDDLPDRLYFVKGAAIRTHSLSVAEFGSRFWVAHLKFRDLLRAHPAIANSYQSLKRSLAAQYPNDRLGYTNAKEGFITSALRNEAYGA